MRFDDIAGARGVAAGHIFGDSEHADDRRFGFEPGDHLHGGEHGHAAAFVVEHPAHSFTGFERDAAGVEGDGFADDDNRFGFGVGAFVFERDDFGVLRAAGGDGEDGVAFFLFEFGFVERGVS